MGNTFKAVTWNVHHGTDVDVLEPILQKLLARGVTVFLVQEASRPAVRAMFERNGLQVAFWPREYAVAWVPLTDDRPDGWVGVTSDGGALSTTAYRGAGGPTRSSAVWAILCDSTGRTIDALSYHTPATVQRTGSTPQRELRRAALRESMAALRDRNRARQTRAALYGGDDNVDEARGRGWAFMLRVATGLRQVPAPAPTFGHRTRGRRIDDFRVAGLRPLAGEVLPGGGDHRIHLRRFRWL